MYVCMYVCMWVPGGVVVRPWAHILSPSPCGVRSPSNTSPPVHPAANGNLEFSGVQIHWPFLIHQPGSGGTSGAHTSGWERWSVLLRVPSQAPGVCSALAPSACLMHRQPGSAR